MTNVDQRVSWASLRIGVVVGTLALALSVSAATIVLDQDLDVVSQGAAFDSTNVVDLARHRLTVGGAAFNGVVFTDTSSGAPGELRVAVPEGSSETPAVFNVRGNLKLVKTGAGRLSIPPMGVSAECAEGQLVYEGKAPIHRWSFTNGSLEDSIGGSTAVKVGSKAITFENNQVTLEGGDNGTCYLDLGTDVLPSRGDVTIEIWGSQNQVRDWSRMFCIGNSEYDFLSMAWSNSGRENSDFVQLKENNSDHFFAIATMAPYTVGTQFHISMRIAPQSDGKSTFSWAKRDVTTGAVLKSGSGVTKSAWSTAKYQGRNFWLGHGFGNSDAAATYDEVRIWNCTLSDDELTANAKAGPDAFPPVVSTEAPELLHCWSFNNGSLEDSVGGSTAVKVGSGAITFENNQVTLEGGNNGTCYLDLGKGVLPVTGDATIEIWGAQNQVKDWSRMFCVGSSELDFLSMAWSNGGNVNSDFVQMRGNGADFFFSTGTMAPYTVGTQFHISLRIKLLDDGTSTLSWAKRDAATGAVLKSGSGVTKGAWSTAKYQDCNFSLGHGFGNSDAAATYDEVRIWKGVLTDNALEANAKAGPDVRMKHVAEGKCSSVEVAAGAVVSTVSTGVMTCDRLGGKGELGASSLLGVGQTLDIAGEGMGELTVNGTLKVLGDWCLDAGRAKACDRVVGTGTLDLSEANLAVRYADDANGPHLIAQGVTVVGHESMTVPGSCYLEQVDDKLYLKRIALVIYVR